MKVLLLRDVYKLGRAGDVKKVADGYGRNFLLTQGMAVLATPGALKQVDRLREKDRIGMGTQEMRVGARFWTGHPDGCAFARRDQAIAGYSHLELNEWTAPGHAQDMTGRHPACRTE